MSLLGWLSTSLGKKRNQSGRHYASKPPRRFRPQVEHLDDRILPSTTPVYGVFETSILNNKSYSNPFDFDVIELRADFTSPGGQATNVTGFYDGNGTGGQTGNVWKLRFMPDEIGSWTYNFSWSDGTPGGGGSVDVVASANKGGLKIDPLNPHSVVYANGEHFFWNGDTEWFFLSDSFTQANRLAAIDFLATKQVNNLLMTMVNDDTFDVLPWVSPSDRTHFALNRLHTWDAVIGYMQTKEIVADLWFYSDDSTSLIPAADSKEEDLYFKTIIARYSAYSNVTWNLALEHDEYRSNAWVVSQAQFVKDEDPFDRLLSVHRTDDTFPFAGDPNLDHTSLQWLGAGASQLNSTIINLRNQTEQPDRASRPAGPHFP